jgi:tetratricopeptide (TPR) repeat protein
MQRHNPGPFAWPPLAGLAHHGLLIAASVADDTSTALVHGWRAFQLVGDDPGRQADLLGTLGAVGCAAGYYDAAVGAYLGAARRSTAARVRLPALAGAAVCAAHLGDLDRLDALTHAIERDLDRDVLPFERAQALALLADAWAARSNVSRARSYAERALAIADPAGFHEIVAEAEDVLGAARDGAPRRVDQRPVGAPAREVLRVLEHLDHVDANDASRIPALTC